MLLLKILPSFRNSKRVFIFVSFSLFSLVGIYVFFAIKGINDLAQELIRHSAEFTSWQSRFTSKLFELENHFHFVIAQDIDGDFDFINEMKEIDRHHNRFKEINKLFLKQLVDEISIVNIELKKNKNSGFLNPIHYHHNNNVLLQFDYATLESMEKLNEDVKKFRKIFSDYVQGPKEKLPAERYHEMEGKLIFLLQNIKFNMTTIAANYLEIQSSYQSSFSIYRSQNLQSMSYFALIFFTLLVLLSYVLNKTITIPLNNLVSGTKKISSGNYDFHIAYDKNDEIGILAKAFNKMTSELAGLIKKEKDLSVAAANAVQDLKHKKYIESIFFSMNDALIVLTPETKIKTINPAVYSLFGYQEKELDGEHIEILFKDSEENIIKKLSEKQSVEATETFYLKKNGKSLPVLFSASLIQDGRGEVTGMVCIVKDMSEIRVAEGKIKKSLKEKEILIQELHHRVKNNLTSILALFHETSQNIKDEKAIQVLKENENRIQSMALVHEQLYRSESLADIKFENYLRNFVAILQKSYSTSANRVALKIEAKDIVLSIELAIPCGLLVHELVANSFKYAFPKRPKSTKQDENEISIKFFRGNNGGYTLIVSDNGVGFEIMSDWRKSKTLGMRLVNSLTRQLNGKGDFISETGKGTTYKLDFIPIKSKTEEV